MPSGRLIPGAPLTNQQAQALTQVPALIPRLGTAILNGGPSGQVLISQGVGTPPIFSNAPSLTGAGAALAINAGTAAGSVLPFSITQAANFQALFNGTGGANVAARAGGAVTPGIAQFSLGYGSDLGAQLPHWRLLENVPAGGAQAPLLVIDAISNATLQGFTAQDVAYFQSPNAGAVTLLVDNTATVPTTGQPFGVVGPSNTIPQVTFGWDGDVAQNTTPGNAQRWAVRNNLGAAGAQGNFDVVYDVISAKVVQTVAPTTDVTTFNFPVAISAGAAATPLSVQGTSTSTSGMFSSGGPAVLEVDGSGGSNIQVRAPASTQTQFTLGYDNGNAGNGVTTQTAHWRLSETVGAAGAQAAFAIIDAVTGPNTVVISVAPITDITTFGKAIVLPVVAFSGLPAAPVEGTMIGINDSNQATFAGTITAGAGANHGIAYFANGAWTFR